MRLSSCCSKRWRRWRRKWGVRCACVLQAARYNHSMTSQQTGARRRRGQQKTSRCARTVVWLYGQRGRSPPPRHKVYGPIPPPQAFDFWTFYATAERAHFCISVQLAIRHFVPSAKNTNASLCNAQLTEISHFQPQNVSIVSVTFRGDETVHFLFATGKRNDYAFAFLLHDWRSWQQSL